MIFAAAIVAFWFSAITGGGASMVLVPLLNLFIPSSLVPFSLTIGTLSSSASRIYVFKKNIEWRIVAWFVPFSIPAVLAGAWLIKLVNPLYLQFIVAVFLLLNIKAFLFSKEVAPKQKELVKWQLALVGFLAGLISGVTGAIGLLFNRFYLKYGLNKEQIIATRAANEVFLHAIKLTVYILLGLYSSNALFMGLAIAGAAIAASFSVKWILPKISELLFRKIGYGTMVLAGMLLMASTTVQIIKQDRVQITAGNTGENGEATIRWRESAFVLEFAFDDGLEIERPITPEELPLNYQVKYDSLLVKYDKILLEKVFSHNEAPGYEFYCYKNNLITKIKFED